MDNIIYNKEQQQKIFADNLNFWLNKQGKAQVDIANHLGVSKATVHFWCKGKKMPRMGKIQLLADFFGIKKSDLVELHNSKVDLLEEKKSVTKIQKTFIDRILTMNDEQILKYIQLLDTFEQIQ